MTTDGGLPALLKERIIRAGGDAQRIETGMTGRGIPDLNYCIGGVEGWIECKATQGWAIGLRPEQVAWISRRSRAGGRCFIAVRRKSEELWLLGADQARQKSLRDAPPFGHWSGGPVAWDWPKILELLTT